MDEENMVKTEDTQKPYRLTSRPLKSINETMEYYMHMNQI